MSDFENLNLKQIRDLGDKIGSEERAKRFMSGELVLVERSEAQKRGVILQFERKVPITARRFVAAESFIKSNTKVRFGYIDKLLLKLFGNVRENVPAGELALYTILKNSHDPEIMVALSQQSKRFVMLGQFYQVLEAQGCGQEGPLLINGCSNIAYITDENCAPWVVRACWAKPFVDWGVRVHSVARPYAWDTGDQVFSQVA